MNYKYVLFSLLLIFMLPSCKNKAKKIKALHGESIYRLHDENFFTLTKPNPKNLPTYPWEERFKGNHPKITKEFFRCRGSSLHPVKVVNQEKGNLFFTDCGGHASHGLPLREGKEFIYPCLIEILNYLQEKTGKKVVITTGHRCPIHNNYCDPSSSNWGSKHMIGAEVDFYIETLEMQPEKVIDLIMKYYKEGEIFKGNQDYEEFKRFEAAISGISTLPWFNKEIFIKLYRVEEGRDFDNQHVYPYISLQVRHDRIRDEKVVYDRASAQNFRRY